VRARSGKGVTGARADALAGAAIGLDDVARVHVLGRHVDRAQGGDDEPRGEALAPGEHRVEQRRGEVAQRGQPVDQAGELGEGGVHGVGEIDPGVVDRAGHRGGSRRRGSERLHGLDVAQAQALHLASCAGVVAAGGALGDVEQRVGDPAHGRDDDDHRGVCRATGTGLLASAGTGRRRLARALAPSAGRRRQLATMAAAWRTASASARAAPPNL
jgi:hypothetical protein